MNTKMIRAAAATLVLAGAAIAPSQAALVIPYADDFDGINSQPALSTTPIDWAVASGGSVDWIYGPDNSWGISCRNGSNGCVDLDGTDNSAGLLSQGVFDLQAGVTYRLSFYLSGNQRGYAADTVTYGFSDGTTNIPIGTGSPPPPVWWTTTASIASGAAYTLYELVVTPTAATSVRIFFQASGNDNVGPMLDDVSLAAVPLPAAAWLLLSGLVGFGALGRRKVAA